MDPVFVCSKHGPQGDLIGLAIEYKIEGKPSVSRKYCIECWTEFFDENLCQLTEKLAEPES